MAEDRTYAQFEPRVPVQFNLNPTYHSVPAIRRMGVGGTIRKISPEDLVIESSLDLRDVCQIFSEEVEDDCHFELELILTNFKGKRLLIRGSVDWYQLSEPDRGIRHFEAGLYLNDEESRTAARAILESITRSPIE